MGMGMAERTLAILIPSKARVAQHFGPLVAAGAAPAEAALQALQTAQAEAAAH
jgi:hypothetical protein